MPDEHITDDLQGLVTGYVMASVHKLVSESPTLVVEWPDPDEKGVYRPYFDVVSDTGTRLRVTVSVIP